jgi:hypothetical protein
MTNNLWKKTVLCILFIVSFSGSPIFSQTTEPESSRKDSSAQNHVDVKVDDLPQPIPKMLDTLKRIGNDVGNEISKATSTATEAVNKAVRADKPSDNKDKK